MTTPDPTATAGSASQDRITGSAAGEVRDGYDAWKALDAQEHAATAALTSSDPEPPVGTVVRDCYGDLWRREPADPSVEGRRRDWFVIETDGSFGNADPETWTRVAGNQGPMEVVKP